MFNFYSLENGLKQVIEIKAKNVLKKYVAATNVALKIVCRRHVARIDFLCNNIALKIVPCNITFTATKNYLKIMLHPSIFLCNISCVKISYPLIIVIKSMAIFQYCFFVFKDIRVCTHNLFYNGKTNFM